MADGTMSSSPGGATTAPALALPKGGGALRSIGEKFDAKVTVFDPKARKMNVSIKALEISDEKEAVAQYGSSDSGASLGDILVAALKKKDAEGKE